jgi:hypothetical protein
MRSLAHRTSSVPGTPRIAFGVILVDSIGSVFVF